MKIEFRDERLELADFARTISGRSPVIDSPSATTFGTFAIIAFFNVANVGISAVYGRSFAG